MGTIAVTGGASGIGAACVARLRAADHDVITVDVHDADVVADLATADGRADAVAGVSALCEDRLDGLVTCAGLGPIPGRAGSLIVSVNYFGTVEVLDGLRPALANGTNAAAVAISSNSTTTTPNVPLDLCELCLGGDEAAARARADDMQTMAGVYPATKLAVAHWVRKNAVSAEWIGAGIRLNAIAPGMIDTAMTAEGKADAMVAPLLDMFPIPIGRPGQADEIAAVVAFLLGSESSFFCGSIVFADGGTDALLRAADYPAPWTIDLSSAMRAVDAD